MKTAERLQLSAALLAGLGTLMLAIGEENAVLALMAVTVAAGAYVLCDVLGLLKLNSLGSNLIAAGALVYCIVRYQTSPPEERILIMADLLAYLQFILQMRAKVTRIYWLIALVSFLQVAVASALYSGLGFALLLVLYLSVGTYFLGVFYLAREQLRMQTLMQRERDGQASRGFGFVGTIQVEDDQARPRSEFRRRTAGLVFGTLLLSGLFFVAVPRVGQSSWSGGDVAVGRTVGFSSEINLTRGGTLVEDPDVVMRVRFTEADAVPLQVYGDLYLRGTSVSEYENGRWQRGTYPSRLFDPQLPLVGSVLPGDARAAVRQQITLEPLAGATIFSTFPPLVETRNNNLLLNPIVGELTRQDRLRGTRFAYELFAPAFRRDGRQADLIPLLRPAPRRSPQPFSQLAEAPNPITFSGLTQRATQVVAGIPPANVLQRCKALEAHLRDSGLYSYSLTAAERPPEVDPLEDFIVTRRTGHCEFFAGALVLMLRSVNIPARVVLGYRGGEWNAVGSFYQFQQLHAHSWVEAFVPSSAFQGPEGALLRDRLAGPALQAMAESNGAWLQLDGTTSLTTLTADTTLSTWHQMKQTVDYLRFLWNNYVVGLDAVRQREEVYRPIAEALQEAMFHVFNRDFWAALPRSILQRMNLDNLLPEGPFFGWRGVAVAFGLVIFGWLAFGAVKAFRRLRRGGLKKAAPRARAAGPEVDFYTQLERILKLRSLNRSADQTQREFVQAACGELAELPDTRGVSTLPRKIVDAFYKVRFGNRPLQAEERSEIDAALASLSTVLLQAKRSPTTPR